MLDVIAPEKIYPREGGLRASWGSWALALETPLLDGNKISDMKEPVIWTALEIEGERPAQPLLLGFSSERRRDLYLLLRSLSGIGRKSALLVLDCGETVDILRAAAGEDSLFFQQVPGLGKKRIEDLLSNLQKKYKGQLPQRLPVPVTEWVEARTALLRSGIDFRQAEELLHKKEGKTAEELLEGIIE